VAPAKPVAPAERATHRSAGPSQGAAPRAPSAPRARGDRTEAGALFGRRSEARGSRSGERAKASASAASASDAGDGERATGAQSGDGGAAAAQAGAADELAMADPVATGAQASEDSSGALPFTGFGVPLLAVIGLLGFAAGLVLRRTARRVTRDGA
jgi:hypothetical protein